MSDTIEKSEDPTVVAIRARHAPLQVQGGTICVRDEEIWPCDAERLLALLALAGSEAARLRAGVEALADLWELQGGSGYWAALDLRNAIAEHIDIESEAGA